MGAFNRILTSLQRMQNKSARRSELDTICTIIQFPNEDLHDTLLTLRSHRLSSYFMVWYSHTSIGLLYGNTIQSHIYCSAPWYKWIAFRFQGTKPPLQFMQISILFASSVFLLERNVDARMVLLLFCPPSTEVWDGVRMVHYSFSARPVGLKAFFVP